MATLLDSIALFENFSIIFVWLLVFTMIYAILSWKKPLGENNSVNTLLSLAISSVFLFSQDAAKVVQTALPWFVIMVFVFVFMTIGKEAFGAKWTTGLPQNIGVWIIILSIIIVIWSISSVFGQRALEQTTNTTEVAAATRSGSVASGNFSDNFSNTFYHPKVLGMLLILFISIFTTLWIGAGRPV